MLASEKNAVEIRAVDPMPVLKRCVLRIMVYPPVFEPGDTRVIYQNVELVQSFDYSLPVSLNSHVEQPEICAQPVSSLFSKVIVDVCSDY